MAQQYKHFAVTFQRDVTQSQTVIVPVPVDITDGDLQIEVAKQRATNRVKDNKWTIIEAGAAAIDEVAGAD